MPHHHFTREDRVLLAKLKTARLSTASCARILGRSPSKNPHIERGFLLGTFMPLGFYLEGSFPISVNFPFMFMRF